jgi:hypothetical protein
MFTQDLRTTSSVLTGNIIDTDAGLIDFGLVDFIGKVPGVIHHLMSVSLKEETFTLDNMSKWSSSNIEMVNNWKEEDELLITQNQAFFSIYRFALVNSRLQKAVPVSLLREPLPIDHKMFFILKIDPANDVITLSNGVEYSVYPNDHGTLRKFSENDRIVMGFNSSDRVDSTTIDSYKSYILIDTTCNSSVRVNPVG